MSEIVAMTIDPAHIGQLDEIFRIFRACRQALESENIFQWNDQYPTPDVLAGDIENKNLFSMNANGKCLGVICINTFQDPEYQAVDWLDREGKVAVIHRLAVDPLCQKQGIARKLMDFAEDYALRHNYTSIRLDAYSENGRSIRFYENRGYDKRGEVHFPGRVKLFFCYEKLLK